MISSTFRGREGSREGLIVGDELAQPPTSTATTTTSTTGIRMPESYPERETEKPHAPIFMPCSDASHAVVSAVISAAFTEPAKWTLPVELVASGSHQSLRGPVIFC